MKKFWNYFSWLLLVIFLFTILDSIVHLTFESLEVYYYPIPDFLLFISSSPLFWYAVGKFFGSLIIGVIVYPIITRIKNYPVKILIFSLITTVLLEVRYILSGYYESVWHVLNFLQHTAILYITAYLIFKKSKV